MTMANDIYLAHLQNYKQEDPKKRSQKYLTQFCKAQPCRALLGYPFHNMTAHTEAIPTREGI